MPGKPLLLSATCLLLIYCKQENTQKTPIVQDTITQKNIKPSASNPQDDSQIETVKLFLKWYKDNEDHLYSFNTIKGGAQDENETPANYYVDFNQVEKELSFLKSSNVLSQKFLSACKKNYVEGDKYFKKNPANDGPPHGFDYDYFFKTQDDYQSDLNNIEAIKFTVKEINPQIAHVEFHLKNCDMTYKYTVIKNNDTHWQIDSIENITK